MENRLYDFGNIVDGLSLNAQPKAVENLVAKYLKAGAHPYFLSQTIRLAFMNFPSQTKEGIYKRIKAFLRNSFLEKETIPEAWEIRTRKAVSRLYDQSENFHVIKDQGIIYGVIVEFFADAIRLFKEGGLGDIDATSKWLAEKVLSHPLADFGVLDTLQHAIWSINEHVKGISAAAIPFRSIFGEYESDLLSLKAKETEEAGKIFEKFIKDRSSNKSIQEALQEILETWNEKAPSRSLAVFINFLNTIFDKKSEFPFTQILEFLLSIPIHGSSRLSQAADNILRGESWTDSERSGMHFVDTFLLKSAGNALILALKEELPSLRTRHAVIRWLKRAPEQIETLIFQLAFDKSAKIDSRAEILVEDVFGKKAWEAICAFQDPSLWDVTKDIYPGITYRGSVKKTLSQYKTLQIAMRESNLKRHEPAVAEEFEKSVHEENISIGETQNILERHLNLLSGDIVLAVSHLRDEWMQVKRKKNEFLGDSFPQVEICRHKQYGDSGAACRFRFKVAGSVRMLKGSLNPDGEVELENTPIIDDWIKLAMRVIVVQTICAALIPIFEDTLPSTGHGGQRLPSYEVPWIRRPVIHTLGKIEDSDGQDRDESLGVKINPMMVELLFRWLLDEQSDYFFRLYIKITEKITGDTETYFKIMIEAKEKLLSGELVSSDVYMRVVRAHTRPLGAYLNETRTLQVKKMSARARNNYKRYRDDGGRELDFSPIQKTYIIPGNIRVPTIIPRTFVQGSFATLREASGFIFDREL